MLNNKLSFDKKHSKVQSFLSIQGALAPGPLWTLKSMILEPLV